MLSLPPPGHAVDIVVDEGVSEDVDEDHVEDLDLHVELLHPRFLG